jgi:hypothetical protein
MLQYAFNVLGRDALVHLLLVKENVLPGCWLASPPPATNSIMRDVFPELKVEITGAGIGEGLLVTGFGVGIGLPPANKGPFGSSTEKRFRERVGDPCAAGLTGSFSTKAYTYSLLLRTSDLRNRAAAAAATTTTTLLVSTCPENVSRAAFDRIAFDAGNALRRYEWLLGNIMGVNVQVQETAVEPAVVGKKLMEKLMDGKLTMTMDETAQLKRFLTERFSFMGDALDTTNPVHQGIALALLAITQDVGNAGNQKLTEVLQGTKNR